MAAESLIQERLGSGAGFMRQQLCLDAMDPRRLLQGLNHMSEQAPLDLIAV